MLFVCSSCCFLLCKKYPSYLQYVQRFTVYIIILYGHIYIYIIFMTMLQLHYTMFFGKLKIFFENLEVQGFIVKVLGPCGQGTFCWKKSSSHRDQWDWYPRCFMFGIFTYIYHKVMINVGKYFIHRVYGVYLSTLPELEEAPQNWGIF